MPLIPDRGNAAELSALGRTLRDWLPVVLLLISGLVWGMKLESRWDVQVAVNSALLERVVTIERAINAGILPLAEEKLRAQQRQIDEQRQEIEDLSRKLEDCFPTKKLTR